MLSLLNYTTLILSLFPLFGVIEAQSSISTSNSTGYTGYNLTLTGDPEDTTYDTLDTPANVSTTYPAPDVYLNASVHIGEIDILVANLTAKINLDASVLNLLKFNAGVDLSIDRVSLTIQNVTAKVLLEARLENLVLMIDDILHSLDLNPVLATLGQDLTNITNTTIGALTGATSTNTKRNTPLQPYDLVHNILFSSNDYSGNTHKNRLLAQNGDIIDQYLNNDGDVQSSVVVGNYLKDMTFNGENVTTTIDGRPAQQLEFVYEPFRGLSVVSFVWVAGGSGEVLGTQVLSERFAGGESSIGD